MSAVVYIVVMSWWIFGIAEASGFWSTLAAFVFPPYAMVVFAMRLLEYLPS